MDKQIQVDMLHVHFNSNQKPSNAKISSTYISFTINLKKKKMWRAEISEEQEIFQDTWAGDNVLNKLAPFLPRVWVTNVT